MVANSGSAFGKLLWLWLRCGIHLHFVHMGVFLLLDSRFFFFVFRFGIYMLSLRHVLFYAEFNALPCCDSLCLLRLHKAKQLHDDGGGGGAKRVIKYTKSTLHRQKHDPPRGRTWNLLIAPSPECLETGDGRSQTLCH